MQTEGRPGVSELADAMRSTPILQHVPAPAVHDLAAQGRARVYEQGTYLLRQGDPSPDVLFLVRGRVEINSLSANGRRQLRATLDAPQLFGELGVLGDIPRTASAVAVEDSTVWSVEGELFLRFLAEQDEASRALHRALARQIQEYGSLVDDLLFLDLKGRVAKRLLGLVSGSLEHLPPDGAVVSSIVTHADLADLSGGSRENVTRILSDLQRRDVVGKQGRRLVLKDMQALARLAGL